MAHPAQPDSLSALTLSLLLLLLTTSIQASQGASTSYPSPPDYVPVPAVVYRSVEPAVTTAAAGDEAPGGGGGGGTYEPFQLCMGCRCCAASSNANSSSCVDTRCCYAIDCNVPGKPFGLCAFSPRTCGCGDYAGTGDSCTTNQ